MIQLDLYNFQQKTIKYLYLTPYIKLLPNLHISQFGHLSEQYCIAMHDHNLIRRCALILININILGFHISVGNIHPGSIIPSTPVQ